jgi:hypothetical protein
MHTAVIHDGHDGLQLSPHSKMKPKPDAGRNVLLTGQAIFFEISV